MLLKLHIKIHDFVSREDGQDMVEYCLMVALLSFGWIATVKSVAGAINSAFNTMSTNLGTYVP